MKPARRNPWSSLLIPFSILYGLGVRMRNFLYDRELITSTEFPMPVISVGNITVGGTGKTPHVEYLAGLLREEFRVAVLSRGYRRRTRDFRVAGPGSGPKEVGDEPVQIRERFPDVVVAVDRDRVNGVRQLMELEPPVEVVLLDDAFQHRAITPGFSILLIDYNRPMVSDRLLPAGRLREPARQRDRAHIILVTKSPPGLQPVRMREYVHRLGLELGQHLFFTTMRYGDLIPVFPGAGEDDPVPPENPAGVLIVSGIAHPGSLREYALELAPRVEEVRFRDHHRYTSGDMDRIRTAMKTLSEEAKGEILVLTTEKDAVKLRELSASGEISVSGEMGRSCFAVRIHVEFLNNDKANFDRQIHRYVTSNKRSNRLYQATD